MAATTRRMIKTKTGNQEDKFAMVIIMHSIDNNKTTVCYLAIPSQPLTLAWDNWKVTAISIPQSRRIEDFQV